MSNANWVRKEIVVREIDHSTTLFYDGRLPLFLNRPLYKKRTVVARNDPPALWMGIYYPSEYVEHHLRDVWVKTILPGKTVRVQLERSGWRVLDHMLFGTSKWELGNELDCFRLYTSHADRARGLSLFRYNQTKASVAN